jgi:hypothetical protein
MRSKTEQIAHLRRGSPLLLRLPASAGGVYLITTIAGEAGACFKSPNSREMRSDAVARRDDAAGGALYTDLVGSWTGNQLLEAEARRVGGASTAVSAAERSVTGIGGDALAGVLPSMAGRGSLRDSGAIANSVGDVGASRSE